MEERKLELKDLERVDLSAGQPPKDMTDEQWQLYFSRMVPLVKQTTDKKMTSSSKMTVNGRDIGSQSGYSGDTSWYYYCQTINTILTVIRRKQHDYCYNIHQIAYLLKFEHDRLRTKWLPDSGCFEVWLNF